MSQKEIIVKDLVDYMTGKEGYRIIAGSIALGEADEDEIVTKFPYLRRIKKRTFNGDFAFNKFINETT